jgi:hypothetical protein
LYGNKADLICVFSSQAYLYNNDNRFFDGWALDKSWVLCTVSWSALVLNAVGVVGAGLFTNSEDDYEPIPDYPQ